MDLMALRKSLFYEFSYIYFFDPLFSKTFFQVVEYETEIPLCRLERENSYM